MKYRFLALALAGTMTFGLLTACGGGDGTSEAPNTVTTPPAVESLTPAPESSAPVVESPTAVPESSAPVEESTAPSTQPSAKPTTKPSTSTSKPSTTTKPSTSTSKPTTTTKPSAPKPTPTPESKPQTNVVASVWSGISKLDLPNLMSLDSATLSALYGINASDLVSYECYIPVTAVHATEFFVAQVKDGKMDAVKAGIAKRQADLQAQWSQYLPEQLELVENYKLVTNGNYVLFAISDHADQAVSIFNSCTK